MGAVDRRRLGCGLFVAHPRDLFVCEPIGLQVGEAPIGIPEIATHCGRGAIGFDGLLASSDRPERMAQPKMTSGDAGPLRDQRAINPDRRLGPDRTWLYNDAFIPIAGRKHPDCLGMPASEVWAEAWTDLKPLFDQVWAGQPIHMDDISLALDRRGKLEEAHFAFSYTPARRDDGTVAGLFGVCIEITDQVLANRVLASEQQRLALLFEQAPTFMAMLRGPEHVIELVNPRYLELVGHRPVLGRTIAEALPDAVAQGYLELLDAVFRDAKAYSAVGSKYLRQETRDGPVDERYVDFVYQPILDSQGAVIGIFVQGVDVTEHKKMEIALQIANETLESRVAERTAELENIRTFYLHSSECHAILALREDGRFEYAEINPPRSISTVWREKK